MIRKNNTIKKLITPFLELKTKLDEVNELYQLSESENDKSLHQDIQDQLEAWEMECHEKEDSLILSGKDDDRNSYLTIHSGAGGTESCDWALMLYRMYIRWAEKHKYAYTVLDYQPGSEAGIKNATLLVKGESAFGYLKTEKGVHRLVRISPFDANKRRHTSFASVDASPEVEGDIQIEINEKDLKIDTFRSSGAGGQHVNTTDSAVRMTHMPTGIVVSCQNERSQHQNRDTAIKMLRSKLYQREEEMQREEKKEKNGQKRKIEWGSQIRSYVFHPYIMVKDHRTGIETGNGEAVMDWELDQFIIGFLKEFRDL